MTTDLFSESASVGFKLPPKCHVSHKDLQFGEGVLLGASCGVPREGYDIYIGFDYGMTFQNHSWPWETENDPVVEFQFTITDMCAPKSPKDFKNLVNYIVEQLHLGKKIHIGCIGGHGRTGLVIAAVKSVWDGTEDATAWTRKNHCKKAVETKSQVNFLYKHFGIKKIGASKQAWTDLPTGKQINPHRTRTRTVTPIRKELGEKIAYVTEKGSIWG